METKTEVKHTPTPWEIKITEGKWAEITKNGINVLTVPYHTDEEKATAQFILIACNNHYQLVEALINACAIIATNFSSYEMKEWANKPDKKMYAEFWQQIETTLKTVQSPLPV